MVTDPETVLLAIATLLDDLDVPYAVGGSLASGRYGEVRATNDVDVVVDLAPRAVGPLHEALQHDFYVEEESIRRAVEGGGTFSAVHRELFQKIDFFVAGEDRLSRLQLVRRRSSPMGPDARTVWFTAPEDVVLRKIEWFRRSDRVLERQWRDVLGVLKVQGPDLDLPYLRARALELGLAALLERALREAGLPG